MSVHPVLFLVFNRPEPTARVLAAIRAARPPRLYLAADGPRPDRPADAALCRAVRELALAVGWPCEVRTLLRPHNLGCRRAVEEALDWFFAAEEAGVVLEDDCLPAPGFFRYCDELLARYRDQARVFSLSGNNFQRGRRRGDGSYYFSKHFHCWGWASWRRAWSAYRAAGEAPPDALSRGLWRLSDGSRLFPVYWRQIERLLQAGALDSWAYRVSLGCFADPGGLVHALPQQNLVANLGYGPDATHTRVEENPAALALEPDPVLRHPPGVERDPAADRFTDRMQFGIAPWPLLRWQLALRLPWLVELKRRLRRAARPPAG